MHARQRQKKKSGLVRVIEKPLARIHAQSMIEGSGSPVFGCSKDRTEARENEIPNSARARVYKP